MRPRRLIVLLALIPACVSAGPIDLQAELNRTDTPLTRIVRVPSGTYTLDQTLVVPSNVTIACAEGAVIEAAPGAFKATGDVPEASLMALTNVSNVQVTGCILRMQGSAYYRDPANGYAVSEWRHCARLAGATGVTFTDCRFEKSGGDGAIVQPFIAPDAKHTQCTNIKFTRCVFAENHRQGLSVVGGSVTVEDSLFTGTAGTSPQAGFDAEPSTVLDFVDVTVKRCHSEKNRGPAWMVGLFASTTQSPPSRVTLEDVTWAEVRTDQPPFRLGGLFSDEFVAGVTARGLPHKNLPKGTFVSINGVVLVDRRN